MFKPDAPKGVINNKEKTSSIDVGATYKERINSTFPSYKAWLLLATLKGLSPGFSEAKDISLNQSGQDSTKNTITISKENEGDFLDKSEKWFNEHSLTKPDAYFRFQRFNEKDSTLELNPWAFISPAQVELGIKHNEKQNVKISVPYKYSRMFDRGEAVNEQDKSEAERYIIEELKKEIRNKIHLFPTKETKDAYIIHNGFTPEEFEMSNKKYKIESITITGHTSPEGPAEKGSSTLGIGAIDKENLALGGHRANDIEPEVKKALQELGLDSNILVNISSDEIQFSKTEIDSLFALASKYDIHGSDSLDAIYNMVLLYNNDGLKNLSKEETEQLARIIDSKRKVEINITLEGGKEERIVFPLPLIPLLLLWLAKKGYNMAKDKSGTTEYYKANKEHSRRIFSEKVVDDDDFKKRELPPSLNFEELYDKALNEHPQDLHREEYELFVNEIARYFDDKNTKDLGLDYRGMLDSIAKNSEENLKTWITTDRDDTFDPKQFVKNLLNQWQEHDRSEIAIYNTYNKKTSHNAELTRSSYVDKEPILRYEQDIKKITWARLGVKQLAKLALALKQGGEQAMRKKMQEMGDEYENARK